MNTPTRITTTRITTRINTPSQFTNPNEIPGAPIKRSLVEEYREPNPKVRRVLFADQEPDLDDVNILGVPEVVDENENLQSPMIPITNTNTNSGFETPTIRRTNSNTSFETPNDFNDDEDEDIECNENLFGKFTEAYDIASKEIEYEIKHDTICSICLYQLLEEEDEEQVEQALLCRTKCLHHFHKSCIDRWVKCGSVCANKCPLCRTDL
jgi:hypothetical protein